MITTAGFKIIRFETGKSIVVVEGKVLSEPLMELPV